MPARKIPKNYLCVTGNFASRKNGRMNGFESLLEKEHMLLLEFDESIESFEEQPVTIPVSGVPKGYTPDLLIYLRADPNTGHIPPPRLIEVKHTDDLKKNAEKYALKFSLATEYAAQRGWEFVIKTEKDIRTPRLSNLKFLREYRNITPEADDCARIIELMCQTDDSVSVQDLLTKIASTSDERLYWMPVIWHMVVEQKLLIDLDAPLGVATILRLTEEMT